MSEVLSAVSTHQQSDLLVVLGKNIGVDSSPDLMRERYHRYGSPLGPLSPESRMNVIAAGQLWAPNTDILFSSGPTAGSPVPTEAASQKALFVALFPKVPEECLHTEEVSIDTAGNAREVAEWLGEQDKRYRTIGLVSIGLTGHASNAAKPFRSYGVPVRATYAAEAVMSQRSPHHARYVRQWAESKRVAQESRRERVRGILLRTIDPYGELLGRVTHKTRARSDAAQAA